LEKNNKNKIIKQELKTTTTTKRSLVNVQTQTDISGVIEMKEYIHEGKRIKVILIEQEL